MTSRKVSKSPSWKEFPFLSQRGIDLIKTYTEPRIDLSMGRFGAYRDHGESTWRIGYGSKKLGKRVVNGHDRITREEAEAQLVEDLKEFSNEVSQYVFVRLNEHKRAALLSFAHSLGVIGFKKSRLLHLINRHAPKTAIISEWSPYINRLWLSGGSLMRDRRRVELNTYMAPDKKMPTFVEHTCQTSICLLNLADSYNGAPNQVKAVEYLEKKVKEWDPSGHVIRRFYRLWCEKPSGLGSQSQVQDMFLDNLLHQVELTQEHNDE